MHTRDVFIKGLKARGLLGRTLLISGRGQKELAFELAAFCLGVSVEALSHTPDFYCYEPEGFFHSIDAMRAFSKTLFMTALKPCGKVFILVDAERMQEACANTLLKSYEEAPQDSLIMLLAKEPSQLLPTVLSRCWHIRLEEKEVSYHPELVALAATLPLPFDTLTEVLEQFFENEENQAFKDQWPQLLLKKALSDLTKAPLDAPEAERIFDEICELLSINYQTGSPVLSTIV